MRSTFSKSVENIEDISAPGSTNWKKKQNMCNHRWNGSRIRPLLYAHAVSRLKALRDVSNFSAEDYKQLGMITEWAFLHFFYPVSCSRTEHMTTITKQTRVSKAGHELYLRRVLENDTVGFEKKMNHHRCRKDDTCNTMLVFQQFYVLSPSCNGVRTHNSFTAIRSSVFIRDEQKWLHGLSLLEKINSGISVLPRPAKLWSLTNFRSKASLQIIENVAQFC